MPETKPLLKKFIPLRWPTRGVYGRLALDEQPAEHCVDAGNVWNVDSISARERGGSRPGLEVVGSMVNAPVRFLGHMNYVNTSVTPEKYVTALVAVCNGNLYTSIDQGVTWVNQGSTAYTDRPVSVACHLQKVYVPSTASPYLKVFDPVAATYTDVSPGTGTTTYNTNTVTVANNSTTVTGSSTVFPTWAASGYITFQDDSGNMGPIYSVATRVSNTVLTLDVPWVQSSNYASGSGKTYALSFDANPPKCTIACTWHDRVILGGDRLNPHLFYGSRIGDGTDWRFGVVGVSGIDPASAFASQSVPGAGAVGEQITALIPANDDQLYIGSTHSLSMMDGDPLNGGILRYVSKNIGPLDQNSWCWIPHSNGDWLAMLTKQGLYVLPPGGRPMPVSREIVPAYLGGLDPSQVQCCLGYDLRYNGLVVSVNPISGSGTLSTTTTTNGYTHTGTFFSGGTGTTTTINTQTAQLFWCGMDSVQGEGGERDIVRPSFWPMSYIDNAQPYAAYNNPTYIETAGTEGSLLMGGKDGKIRRHRSDLGPDSDFGGQANVSSFIVYGPFPLANEPGYYGILNSLDVVLAQSSGTPIKLDVFTGYSAEEAYQAYLNFTPFNRNPSAAYAPFQINNVGLNTRIRIRARGSHACLRFYADVNIRWALESVVAYFQQAGQRRKR